MRASRGRSLPLRSSSRPLTAAVATHALGATSTSHTSPAAAAVPAHTQRQQAGKQAGEGPGRGGRELSHPSTTTVPLLSPAAWSATAPAGR
ncbi:unnamed protein product [Hydatigera taeniaeformis]|uniref:Secreted protein n=1 Tax=Hydatigena taeniaeformis TaxID=6205 RepID=A0A0R3WI52_HYDTA|nr:unnamed protein product [Hydatigera taeniaeformis]